MARARLGTKFRMFFFITVFIFSLFINNALATRAEFETMKKIEETQNTTPPETIVRPKVEYNAEDLSDPFRGIIIEETPPSGEEQALEVTPQILPSLDVQGVIWGGRFPQAIINNKVVKIGDTIEGAVVISIDKDGITVLFAGRQYNLGPPTGGTAPNKNPGGEDEKNF